LQILGDESNRRSIVAGHRKNTVMIAYQVNILEIMLKRLKPLFVGVDVVGFVDFFTSTFEFEDTVCPFVAWPLVPFFPFFPDFAALPLVFAIVYSMQIIWYRIPVLDGLELQSVMQCDAA